MPSGPDWKENEKSALGNEKPMICNQPFGAVF